jgi:hypothetical protein
MADDTSLVMDDYQSTDITQRKRRFSFHYIQTPFSRPSIIPASIDPTAYPDYNENRSSSSTSFVASFTCEGEQYRSDTYAVNHRVAAVKSSSDSFDYINDSSSDGQDDSNSQLLSTTHSSKRQVMYYPQCGHMIAAS